MTRNRTTAGAIVLVVLVVAMDCSHGHGVGGKGGRDGAVADTAGATGADTTATGGSSGDSDVGVRDADIASLPDGSPVSGPCGEATCLTTLFQTCVPEGDCTAQGAGSPSAVFSARCYENGVQVSVTGIGTGAGTSSDLSVMRDRTTCYAVKGWAPTGASGMSYTITGANGEQVATGMTADKSGFVTVTCNGGSPVTVSAACLDSPVGPSSCGSGPCPGDSGGSGGAGGTTGGTGGSTGGADASTATDSADSLRCTLARGPDSEPGSTCEIYCDDLRVMCKSTPGVPATSAECVSNCQTSFTEAQLCCRAAHLMNGTDASTACEEALGRGACL